MNKSIEDLDKEIIALFSERTRLYIEVKKKHLHDSGCAFSAEDIAITSRLIETYNKGPVTNAILKKMYKELISCSQSLVQPIKVAYLGPVGTFCHIALVEIFGESIISVSQNTISDVFHEVEMGRVSFGVVPVENSTEGAVTYTLDELLDTDLKIVSEKFLRISYSLLSLCEELKGVKKLYSHPQPIAQCKGWIRRNLPNAEIHYIDSTAQAAEIATWDKYSAAIASETSAVIYSLRTLATNIEDSRHNYTRFLVIGQMDNPPTGRDKTSIVCALKGKDKSGTLYSLLKPFSDAGVNMTKIESRPNKKKKWEYNFFIDFNGHQDDRVVKIALDEMREETQFLKILGSYPAE
ncbi:MAG: prephenate dehydratase [Spirochaetota bacterium]|nr:prephenate dehydratase [Spirochaetota bacterium]